MTQLKPRVAMFISNMNGAGAQAVWLALARGMVERDYVVDLVLAQATGSFLKDVPSDVRIIDLNASRVLASLPALVRYLRRERPQAFISAMNYINLTAIWARILARVPTRLVITEHNTVSHFGSHSANFRFRVTRYLLRFFYPLADEIVAVSKGTATDLAQVTCMNPTHIQTIYNPVILPELREKAQMAIDDVWFKAHQPPVILAVGRLNPQKDFETLIRAFALVRKQLNARLLILGEGDERAKLESVIEELHLTDDVRLPGFINNPYAYMSRAALFVLSSKEEGLGNVLIEALYCGASLVSTDCPHGPNEILRGGQYGKLVQVGDIEAMSTAIINILTNPPQRQPEESWRPYRMETVVDQYLTLLFKNK